MINCPEVIGEIVKICVTWLKLDDNTLLFTEILETLVKGKYSYSVYGERWF